VAPGGREVRDHTRAVFVLFARVRLATGPLGYGLLLAVMAAEGLVGGLAGGR
jgi:hypothetical protein